MCRLSCNPIPVLFALFLLLSLGACGGGGGSDSPAAATTGVNTGAADPAPESDDADADDGGAPSQADPEGGYVWTAYVGVNDGVFDPPQWSASVRDGQVERYASSLLLTHDGLMVDYFTESLNLDDLHLYLDTVTADAGASQKAAVRARAEAVLAVQQETATERRVYWQFDNEINKEVLSANLGAWRTGDPGYVGIQNDPEVIPMYVEYYLAPSVEAILEVERETGGDIPIMLGSLGNGNGASNRDWYRDLLSYRVEGTFAPSLAGSTVADLVEFLSFHYTVGLGEDAHSYLDDFRLNMMPMGANIRGMWSTEEIGRVAAEGGRGAIMALGTLAQYLSYWQRNGMSPEQGRVHWWGWYLSPEGVDEATGREGMDTLFDFVGHTVLDELQGILETPDFSTDLYRNFVYSSRNDTNRRVAFVQTAQGQDPPTVQLQSLSLQRAGWQGTVDAQLHIFRETGNSVLPMVVTATEGTYELTLAEAQTLDRAALALVLLTHAD